MEQAANSTSSTPPSSHIRRLFTYHRDAGDEDPIVMWPEWSPNGRSISVALCQRGSEIPPVETVPSIVFHASCAPDVWAPAGGPPLEAGTGALRGKPDSSCPPFIESGANEDVTFFVHGNPYTRTKAQTGRSHGSRCTPERCECPRAVCGRQGKGKRAHRSSLAGDPGAWWAVVRLFSATPPEDLPQDLIGIGTTSRGSATGPDRGRDDQRRICTRPDGIETAHASSHGSDHFLS